MSRNNAANVVQKLREDIGDEAFLEWVRRCGTMPLAAAEIGANYSTIKKHKRAAQKSTGWKVVYDPSTKSSYIDKGKGDTEKTAEERAEELQRNLDAMPEPEPLPDDVVAETDAVMVERESEDDEDEDMGHSPSLGRSKLPPIAFVEDLPREFCGGMHGGEGKHPGHGATVEQLVQYYRDRTNVWEGIHEVRLAVAPGKSYAAIHPIGDVHIGDDECDFAKVEQLIDWIARQDGHYVLGMGDYFEATTLGSVRRASIHSQVVDSDEAMLIGAHLFKRVVKKTIALGRGNHEMAFLRDTGQPLDPLKMMCRSIGAPYALYDFPLIVHVGEQTYTLIVHHGAGGARTLGALVNEAERLLNNNEVDAALMGHAHQKAHLDIGKQGVVERPDGEGGVVKTWDTKSKPIIRTGSFKRYSAGSFARTKNMKPAVRGTMAIRLYATHNNIHTRG